MQNLFKISNVFVDRMFQIPDYQRGYAWGQRQWDDFLEDLELLPDGKEHFTGTLILHNIPNTSSKMDEAGQAYTVLDVVDGQQRLTTIVLLLDAIRREMEQVERLKTMAAGIQRSYITVQDLNGQPMPKLMLNRDCHDFFYNNILEQNPSPAGPQIRSHQLLQNAKAHFQAYLAQKDKSLADTYINWLVSLYQKITQQLTLIVYTVTNEADAGVLFETMNNRGKQITELEKVKNYLLYLASKLELKDTHNLPHTINQTWRLIFERLMAAGLGTTDNEDQLLRAHWLMAYDYERKRWNGSRSIKDRFNLRAYQGKHQLLLTHLQEYITTLGHAAIAYTDIYKPTHSEAFNDFGSTSDLRNKVIAMSEKLPRLGTIAQFLPFLMATRLKYPGASEIYLTAVTLCEKFAFRVYHWCEWRPYTGLAKLYRLGYTLFQGTDFQLAKDELTRILLHYCPNEQNQSGFELDDEANDWYRWSALRYFLYEYEEHLAQSAGKEVKMLWSMVDDKPNTIEHILPQNPERGSEWTKHFPKKLHKKYIHDIGNLSLTQDNQALSNKTFAEKKGKGSQKNTYSGSILFMEKDLCNYSQWTENEIVARRKEIEDWALKRWDVEPPSAPPPTQHHYKVRMIARLAEQQGVKEPFQKILAAASRHHLHPRPHKKCVVYAPPDDKTRALFVVSPELGQLKVGVWHKQFAQFYPVTREQFRSIFGPAQYHYVTEQNVNEFTQRLDELFELIKI